MVLGNSPAGLEAHCISSSHFQSSKLAESALLPSFLYGHLRIKVLRALRCSCTFEYDRALKLPAVFNTKTRSEGLFELGGREFTCRAANWADRLSRDLYGVGPNESSGEESEAVSLGRQRMEDRNGSRGSKGISALASAFPAVTSKTEKTVALPIDYYQVLGADTHFLADAIVRAYEARVNNVPEEGFSQEALVARQEILRGACETLADPDLRGDYNQSLVDDEAGTLMVEVPWSKVPGALCLLQEVGEMEVVLRVGQDLLQERLSRAFLCDVVLAMALAYVELSREALTDSPQAIVRSCEMLEIALKLLQDEGGSRLAPALQAQIDETLRQIKPRCILELLAFPLDEDHRLQRQEGLQGLRSILWAVSEGGAFAHISGFARDEFMKEAFAHMTAAEQVALFTATPSDIPAEGSEVYTAAFAHVAEGFVGKKPYLIQEADALFSQLQLTNATALSDNLHAANQGLDFTLERGMCALLLGELDKCRAWLGLDDGNSPYRIASIVEFVFLNSGDSDETDSLPGLCKLLESWLSEVIFPTFRDTSGLQLKLGDYYDDPGVLNYLERLEKGGSPLAAAAAIVKLGAEAGAALDTVKTSALETLQKVFPLRKSGNSLRVKDISADMGPDTARPFDLAHNEHAHFNLEHEVALDSADESLSSLPAPSLNAVKMSSNGWDDGEEQKPSSFSMVENKASNKHQGLTPVQVIFAGATLGALALAGWRGFGMPGWQQLIRRFSPSVTVTAGSVRESVKKVPKMDARLAELVVRKWQSAKAQALGSNHVIAQLTEVLDGQMLNSWADRARDVAKQGWYWVYKLLDLSIDSVTISTDGRRATVEATLRESAFLYDSNNPEITDSYNITYTTRYELVYADDNWKITSGVVLHS